MNSLFVGGRLVKIDIADGFVYELTQGDERVPRAQCGSSRHVWSGRRKLVLSRRGHVRSPLSRADFANPAAVFAEVGGDVVLAVPSRNHALRDRYFRVCKRHTQPPELTKQCREDVSATRAWVEGGAHS